MRVCLTTSISLALLFLCSCDGGFLVAAAAGYIAGSSEDNQTITPPSCPPADWQFPCVELRDDCDGNPRNGCESSLETPANCGACGSPCVLPNALTSCAGGMCAVLQCATGWSDHDRIAANGCEYDLSFPQEPTATWTPCGAYTADCDGDMTLCDQGNCEASEGSVTAGDAIVNGCETDVVSDPLNCGACGRVCPPVNRPNAEPACVHGQCVSRCVTMQDPQNGDRVYANCYDDSMSPASQKTFTVDDNGCETDLNSAPNDCGVCGHACESQENCDTGICK
jgi:hypothetical protein